MCISRMRSWVKIYFYDLSSVEEKYRIARDLFLISAFTGLRISDNKRLKDENIVEDSGSRFFKIESKKTKTELIIPISNIVEEILSRNNGLPKSMADQTVNILIKEIGEWVGLDQVVYISRTKGGEKTSVKHMKYELIKTHTARRSFCTNAYLGGMDTLLIMAVSGHKTERNFLTYIKVTKTGAGI